VDEFKQSISALNQRLESRNKEVQVLAEKIVTLEGTLQAQRTILTPARIEEMTESLNVLKRDYQRKATDLRSFAASEQQKSLDPVLARLGTFALEYGKQNGIVILLDLGNAIQLRALLWHDPRIDVTGDFVAAYNKAHPVPAPAPKP
jgi:Skp family chaperone for outer membrane proteins